MNNSSTQDFMSRISIESREDYQDGETGIVHYIALDGKDIDLFYEYEDKCMMYYESDCVYESNLSFNDIDLLHHHENDIVNYLKDNGYKVKYPSY